MENPQRNLKIVIVIPCLAETQIMETIGSLRKNVGFNCFVECLIVVNHSESAPMEIKLLNQNILDQIRGEQKSSSSLLKFQAIEAFNLPDKKSGVGMARKIGMNMAVERLNEAGTFKEGIIVCLDGDCTVHKDYLAEIEQYFAKYKANGCSIYFEHPLDNENQEAIIDYELFLRYYNNALRWTGFLYAFQTVGSAMAVSASAYQKQCGMNTRKAGEDFYFLNKIIQLGNFGDLVSTTVYPSARKSERVPFGTGREMIEWERGEHLLSYHPDLFIESSKVFGMIDQFSECESPIGLLEKNNVHPVFISYLNDQDMNGWVAEAKSNSSTIEAFRKRFFVWMNAFRVMKLLNALSGPTFPKIPIYKGAVWLWGNISDEIPGADAKKLLVQFREFDRDNPKRI
jgi:hypothetical protein